MKKNLIRFALLGLATLSGSVFAQSNSCSFYVTEFFNGNPTYAGAPKSHPECFAGGGSSANTSINSTSFTQAMAVSNALSARFSGMATGPVSIAGIKQEKGMAAGVKTDVWNVWGSLEKNDSESGYMNSNNRKVTGSNNVSTYVVGADYLVKSQWVIGLSAALDDSKGKGESGAGTISSGSDGYLLSPYIGYQLTKELAVDFSAGLGKGKFSSDAGMTADAKRRFAAANLSYGRWMGNLQLSSKLSYLHGEEDYSDSKNNGVTLANSKSKNTLDQVRVGAQAGYWMNGVMPFAGLAYSSNVQRKSTQSADPLGRDTLIASLGVNFFSLSSKISGGLLYSQELNRENSKNQIISGNLNFRF